MIVVDDLLSEINSESKIMGKEVGTESVWGYYLY